MNIKPDKRLLYAVIIILLAVNAVLLYGLQQSTPEQQRNFDLLNPSIAMMSVDEFLEIQDRYTASYKPLREKVQDVVDGKNGTFGFYFEDLATGAWTGINERQEFIPASLPKVPIMVAVLKRIEEGELRTNQSVKILESDVNTKSGTMHLRGSGYNTTIIELLRYMINESDNTAENALKRHITSSDLLEAQLGLGLQLTNEQNPSIRISPKDYSNIFRSLYYSGYLRRQFSQLALSLLSETKFASQIPANLPPSIKTAHKVGVYDSFGVYHDCGILYAPEKHYILCVMSSNTTRETADSTIKDVSLAVYDYVSAS